MTWGMLDWPATDLPVAGTRPEYITELLSEYFGGDVPDRPGQIERLRIGLGLQVVLEKLPAGKVGQLREDRDKPTIVIDSDVPRTQWFFVVAHEIGHFMINRLHQQSRPELRPGLLAPDLLERICDAIAGDLLLPHAWMRDVLAHEHDLSLVTMHARAEKLAVARGTLMQAIARAGGPIGWVRTAQYRSGATHFTSEVGPLRIEARELAGNLPPFRLGHTSRSGGLIEGRPYALDIHSRAWRSDVFCEYLLRPL